MDAYWMEHKDAEETAKAVKDAGRECLNIPGDLAQEEQCKYAWWHARLVAQAMWGAFRCRLAA